MTDGEKQKELTNLSGESAGGRGGRVLRHAIGEYQYDIGHDRPVALLATQLRS